ncbi:FMN-binding negative transcriptional regulator [Pseudoduganella umbonata]|uniref:Transcriptional regulator n=1 Tax=Pseudoduganella umbonata TaxID=864828 RepID=A0A4P8HKQ7_9BURK|nr:FMN-binding negative transcriptional regulator [Pseudoduganella umbonata]MBB3219395.1 transcriptional regulator [Pseudoduganella umbonata]QCP09486.1 FMN-binding negative transcriptional regulator [Pseudoduganella umbonata]
MYNPASFAEDRLAVQHALIRAHPLATLVVAGSTALTADLVPFLLYPDEGPHGTLRAHVARANPLWRELEGGAACLLLFQGPQAYVSPGWYPSKAETHKVVPTWNYAMVQVRGTARVTDDGPWLQRQLRDLTAEQEGALPRPWSLDDAPADFVAALTRAVVGIEIPIAHIAAKWKVSQNRSAADRAGVAEGLAERAPDMAALVRQATGA